LCKPVFAVHTQNIHVSTMLEKWNWGKEGVIVGVGPLKRYHIIHAISFMVVSSISLQTVAQAI